MATSRSLGISLRLLIQHRHVQTKSARCVLALAYLKRAGVRHLFIGKLFERRPSYHILGVLLFTQIIASAGIQALQKLASSRRTFANQHAQHAFTSLNGRSKAGQPAVVLKVRLAMVYLSQHGLRIATQLLRQ